MRLGFNASLLYSPNLRGWNRYAINLLVELCRLGAKPILYSNKEIHPQHLSRLSDGQFAVRVASEVSYFVWQEKWLPDQCKKDGVDVFHSPYHYGLPFLGSFKRVLTQHDAIAEKFYETKMELREWLRPDAWTSKLYRWSARARVDQVITPSQYSKEDLVKQFKFSPDRVSVIYEGVEDRFRAPMIAEEKQAVRRKLGLARPFVLYVGGWDQHKNLGYLLGGFAMAEIKKSVDLVIAGSHTGEQEGALRDMAATLGIGDSVRFLGFIEDRDLPALYSEALCFVYPSLYEGFGLQLLEAMSVGCPVLASNVTCLPEILGKGGEAFSVSNPQGLVGLLKRVAGDSDFRERLSERAVARAGVFSWRKAAEETLRVYERVLRG